MYDLTFVDENARELRPLSVAAITPDYFLEHYLEFIALYIAGGRPSLDTLSNRKVGVGQFISWCQEKNVHPLAVQDYQMRIYMQHLYAKGYKTDSVAQKINELRSFFLAAEKLGLIKENPCKDLHAGITIRADEMVPFFTVEQMGEVCKVFREEPPFLRLRNTLIIYLMGVEGMRRVEVHRACREDIDWENLSILVHGKGHDRRIYPCQATFDMIKSYYDVCPKEIKLDGSSLTPLILSNSNNHKGGRISRSGLCYVVSTALATANLKAPGVSCHALRHSCGSNLYAATKDLRLVQETLGHRDPKTTTRYAHLGERMTNRSTNRIVPHI